MAKPELTLIRAFKEARDMATPDPGDQSAPMGIGDRESIRMFLEASAQGAGAWGAIRFNLLKHRAECHRADGSWQTWTDIDTNDVQHQAELAGICGVSKQTGVTRTPSKDHIDMTVDLIAWQNQYDPVREYLDKLPAWDGTPRVDRFFVDQLRCPDTELNQKAGFVLLGSMIKRALEPGCKCDVVPILAGEQGCRKSSAFRKLVPYEAWFSDAELDLDGNVADAAETIRGAWLFELAECSCLNRADAKAQKAFVSRQKDEYRAAYGRRRSEVPRRGIMVGTLNVDDSGTTPVFRDPTGNRRYLVCESEATELNPIDVDGIALDRDQLFAEALARVERGEAHWLDRASLVKEQRKANLQHSDVDPALKEQLATWIASGMPAKLTPLDLGNGQSAPDLAARKHAGRPALLMFEICKFALAQTVMKADVVFQRRVAAAMRSLGWEAKNTTGPGRVKGNWWLGPE
jgi:predicted P-loop ATPase